MDGIWLLDTLGHLIEVNDSYCRMSGYTAQELLTMRIADLDACDTDEDVAARMHRIIAAGASRFITKHRRKDGTVFDVEISVQYREDEGGRVVTFLRDITDQLLAEEQLSQSRKLLVNLLNQVPGVVYQYLLYPDGRSAFPYSSPGMNTMYEVTPEEVQEDATPVFGRLHPEDYDNVAAAIYESARTLETFYSEFRVILPRQGLRWRWSQAQPERMPDGGTLWHGIISDITERKQTEIELARSQLLLTSSIESQKDTILLAIDNNYRYLFFNKTHSDVMKHAYNTDVAVGMNILECITSDDDRKAAKENYGRALRGESHSNVRMFGEVEPAYFESYFNPVLNDKNEIIGATALARDISERIQAEREKTKLEHQLQQAQKMESVGRLAGGVAHDFNNMLTVILGHAEMGLLHVDPEHPVINDLKEISNSAVRSAELTRQLLAFARKQTIAPKVIDLNDTVAGMLKMLQRLIGEDITLTLKPLATLWPVKMDASQLDQILANLCVNARDAIADIGKISIETGNCTIDENYSLTHADSSPGDYVRLTVSDDGCGMDKETLTHIFEPFYTTKEIGKGTGLGLATVYGAARQNGGFVDVYSEPGTGTTFTVYLPRHEGKSLQEPLEGTTEPTPKGNETILLVEDEPAILHITMMILTKQGYKVLPANTPGEAMELAREHAGEIHLLMTDVVMPEMNGRDLAKNLLSIYPGMKRLFMSGYTGDVIAHHGVLDDGVHFIQKPFNMNLLAGKLREVLDS